MIDRLPRFVARAWALLACLALTAACGAPPTPENSSALFPLRAIDLRCEARRDPIGIGSARPRLTWCCVAPADDRVRGRALTGCELRAASSLEALLAGNADRWASGRIAGDAVALDWGGSPLPSRARVFWQVRSFDESSRATAWSEPARFTVGLLAESDWAAHWIGAADAATSVRDHAPWLRATFDLPAAPRRARAWIASLGYHELWLNGHKIGDELLMPSVSDLSQRTRVMEREIECGPDRTTAPPLHAGKNAIGLWIGSGWAAHAPFAVTSYPLVRAQLEIELVDGRCITVSTDESWRTAGSGTTRLGTWEMGDYGGERIDAARAHLDWSGTAVDDATWPRVQRFDPGVVLVAEACEPNRRIIELAPVTIEPVGPSTWRIDFGRNFTGVTRATLHGAPGAVVTLSWSERRDTAELFAQRGELVLDAAGEGTFEHRFNYAAGRWLTITGTDLAPRTDDVRAWLVRSDYDRGARFECGDERLQQLHDTAAWTFENLALGGVPVDCPHRERHGYGGDAHATMGLGLELFRSDAFFAKWQDDWHALQRPDGNLPFTAPGYIGAGGPAWSGIVVTLAWEQWRRSGDVSALRRCWPTIERWLAWLDAHDQGGLLEPWCVPEWAAASNSYLGDWLAPGAPLPSGPPNDSTRFFNSAYRIACVRLAASMAGVLGDAPTATRLTTRADELAQAVHERFFRDRRGGYPGRGATPTLMARFAELGDSPLRQSSFDALRAELAGGGALTTGMHGTWRLVEELLASGQGDLLVQIAKRSDSPSWSWFVDQGLTTFPEDWSAQGSLLHSCWLSIGVLGIEALAGIRPDDTATPTTAGYRRFIVEPAIASGVPWARGELTTPHGPITVDWRRETEASTASATDETVTLDLTVPIGTCAELRLPAAALDTWKLVDDAAVEPGRAHPLPDAIGHPQQGVAGVEWHTGKLCATLRSGRYRLLGVVER